VAGRILPAIRLQPPQQPSPPPAPPRHRFRPIPTWRAGDKVRWQAYSGVFLRDALDGQAEMLIGSRTYRLPKAELRPAGPR
jgi:hypothetical protein